ncbi:MAG: hypothetical protein RQ745_03355 [Longimicrobiales bacterium]|nr:hypothetical protein [Longimicrobiales bacterium]
MSLVPIADQPDDARIWIFPARDPLSREGVDRLMNSVEGFLDAWEAHGRPLRASAECSEDRFLIVAVDRASEPPSGCSIDALVRHLGEIAPEVGTSFVDHAPVWFRAANGSVACVSRAAFRDLADRHEIDRDTRVFDTTLTALSSLRSGKLEVPASDTWHGAAFFD